MKVNNLKKTLIKHWDELLILFVTAIILITIFIPFFLNNSLDKFDTPGLLSLSWFIREYTFPDFQGWNPYFFAGFPQGILYPPLFHWTVALLGQIFHLSVAYKLVVTAAASFIPFTIYEFSLKFYKTKRWAILSTLLILITLVILPGYLGFNFDSLFDYGLGPSFVTIPLFFSFLALLFDKKKNITAMAIIFSIMLLTNLVATFISGLIVFTYCVLNIKNNKKLFIKFTLFALISFTFTTFWTIPYLVFQKYTASGLPPMRSNTILSIFVLAGTLITIGFITLKKQNNKNCTKYLSLLIPGVLIAILTLLDATSGIVIPPIHPFRLQIFAFIAVAASSVYIIQTLHPLLIKFTTNLKVWRYIKRNTYVSFNLFLISLVLFILTILRLNPNGVEKIQIDPNLDWQGRIMRAYKVTEVLDQSRAVIDKSVMQNPDRFAVDGLLKESSYLAPYFQSLSKSINSDNFDWEKLDQHYIENQKLPPEKAIYLMNLLWVKSLLTIDREFPYCKDFDHLDTFHTNTKDEGINKRDMYICSYAPSQNSNLVEMVTKQPKTINEDWKKELEDWWISDSQELFTNKTIEIKNTSNVIYIPQVEFSDNYQKVYIRSGVEDTLHYLIKMSYFPKWKAYDLDGNEIEIYRASPNFMIVPIKEEIVLEYKMTSIEWISLIISVISWIGLGVISIAIKLKNKKLKILTVTL